MLYLKVANLQVEAAYDKAAVALGPFATRDPRSNDADTAQLQLENGYRQPGDDEIDRLIGHDAEAMLAIGDAYLMLGRQSETLTFCREPTDTYPYLNNGFSRASQDGIDVLIQFDTLRTNPKFFPPPKWDNVQYQIITPYFCLGYDDTATHGFDNVYIGSPEGELIDNAMWECSECYWQKARQRALKQNPFTENQPSLSGRRKPSCKASYGEDSVA